MLNRSTQRPRVYIDELRPSFSNDAHEQSQKVSIDASISQRRMNAILAFHAGDVRRSKFLAEQLPPLVGLPIIIRSLVRSGAHVEALEILAQHENLHSRYQNQIARAEAKLLNGIVRSCINQPRESQSFLMEAKALAIGNGDDIMINEILLQQSMASLKAGDTSVARNLAEAVTLRGTRRQRVTAREVIVASSHSSAISVRLNHIEQNFRDLLPTPWHIYLLTGQLMNASRLAAQDGALSTLKQLRTQADSIDWGYHNQRIKSATYLNLANGGIVCGDDAFVEESLIIAEAASNNIRTYIEASVARVSQAVSAGDESRLANAVVTLARFAHQVETMVCDPDTIMDLFVASSELAFVIPSASLYLHRLGEDQQIGRPRSAPREHARIEAARQMSSAFLAASQNNLETALQCSLEAFQFFRDEENTATAILLAILLYKITGSSYFEDIARDAATASPDGVAERRIKGSSLAYKRLMT